MNLPLFLRRGLIAPAVFLAASCISPSDAQGVYAVNLNPPAGKAVAAFAEGCFWHAQIVFEAVKGVDSAISGYAGGHKKNPSYDDVTSETSGHTETVLVYYDPKVVSYGELLNAFFTSVDPTTKDRQGNDVGSSYRSAIFYKNAQEQAAATAAIRSQSSHWPAAIVTQVLPLNAFYRAEQYHQGYAFRNPGNSYVSNVSIPEYKRFCKAYKGQLKEKRRF